uniref:HNH nuclease domain-containing protein n=1 Tax=Brassica campestris TaxID=3711 RepID=M4DNQ5_BRACM
MKHAGKDHHRRRNRGALSSSSPSPPKTRPSGSPSRTSGGKVATSATLLDREETGLFPGSGYDDPNPEPRSFPYSVKQQCWEKAEKIKGRDPERWRRDPLGNIVFRKLVGCPGCLCHDYDHIVPYSKNLGGKDHTSIVDIIHQGGKSTLDNCQVLQAKVNRSKGNKTDISRAELIQRSSYCRVAGRDMDLIELTAYGNVQRAPESSGCRMQ